jgi:hypothetical protein
MIDVVEEEKQTKKASLLLVIHTVPYQYTSIISSLGLGRSNAYMTNTLNWYVGPLVCIYTNEIHELY